MDTALPDYVTKARSDAQKMGQAASDFAAASYTIPDELKKVVQEALDYNKDVISGRSTAWSDYSKAPADANVKFGVQQFTTGQNAGQANPNFIFNPFERNKAISDYTANQKVPFNFFNTLLGLREGTTADTVRAGTNAFNAQATDAQNKAQLAQTRYTDALDEFKTLEDINYRNRQLAQEKELTLMKMGGENSGLTGLTALLESGSVTSLKDFITPENVLSMIALDPKNKDVYTAMLKTVTPTASQQKATLARDTAKNDAQFNISQVDKAIALLKKNKTGPLSGKVLAAQIGTGIGVSQSERELYNLIGRISAQELFSLGGKTLPAQEISRLLPFVPDLNLPTEQNITNLTKLKERLNKSYDSLIKQDFLSNSVDNTDSMEDMWTNLR